MFDRIMSIFKKDKRVDTPPVKSGFLSPKAEPVKKPTVVLSSQQAPLPAVIQDRPPAILLPGVSPAPAATSKPMEDMKPFVQLPPDIDPNQVVVVRHDVKKADTERFRYVDKPLKPLSSDMQKADVIKYAEKKPADVIKYKAASSPRAEIHERPAAEKPRSEVFKYTPTRVEIKS